MVDKMTAISEWVKLSEVPDLIKKVSGYHPSRASIYRWAIAGKLKVANYRPLRTRRTWIMNFLEKHYKGFKR